MWTPEGYRHVHRLGEGGGASVHLLEDPASGERVSLKLADDSAGTLFREAVLREVRLLERVDYPGLPRVLDSGTDRHRSWYTYRYVEGRPLSALGAAESTPAFDAVAAGLFGALFVLHDLGLVHYDVSGDNVIVSSAGSWEGVTLIDFGHAGGAGRTLLGTPGYMAPEILRGEAGGPESDLFSAGVALAEFALGERLFGRRTQREIVTDLALLIDSFEPRLRSVLGEDRADLLLRCMAPDRRDRVDDACEALAALDALRGSLLRRALTTISRAGILSVGADGQARASLKDSLVGLRWETGSANALAEELQGELIRPEFELGRFLAHMVECGHVTRSSGAWLLCRFEEERLAGGMDPGAVRALLDGLRGTGREAVLALAAAEETGDEEAAARVGRALDGELGESKDGLLRSTPSGPRLASRAVGAALRLHVDPDELRKARLRAAGILTGDATGANAAPGEWLRVRAGEYEEETTADLLRSLADVGHLREAKSLSDALDPRIQDGLSDPLLLALAWARAEARDWSACRRALGAMRSKSPDATYLAALADLQLDTEPSVSGETFPVDAGGDEGLARLAIELERPGPVTCEEGLAEILRLAGADRLEVKKLAETARESGHLGRHALLTALNALGRRRFREGQVEEAKELFCAGEGVASALGMESREALFAGNVANCLLTLGETDEAARILEQSARRREELGDAVGAINVWGNLGVLRYNAGENDAALLSWERQAELVRKEGLTGKMAAVQCRIACALQEIGSWTTAREALDSSIRHALASGDASTEILARMNLCLLLLTEGRIAAAGDALRALESVARGCEISGEWRSQIAYLRARIRLDLGRPVLDREATLRTIETRGDAIDEAWSALEPEDRVEIAIRNALLAGIEGDFRSLTKELDIEEDDRAVLDLLCFAHALPELRSETEFSRLPAPLPEGVITTATAEQIALFTEILIRLEAERGRSPGKLVEQVHDLAHRAGLPGLLWRAHLASGLKYIRRSELAAAVRVFGTALRGFHECLGPGSPNLPASVRGRFEFRALGRALRNLARRTRGEHRSGDPVEPPEEDTLPALQELVAACALDLAGKASGGGKWEQGIEKILSVVETLNTTMEIDPLLVQVVESVLDLCDAEYGFMVLLDEQGAPGIRVARGGFANSEEAPENLVSKTVISRVLSQRRSILIQNALDEEGLVDRPSVQLLSLQSVMCAPLVVKEKLLGAILVDNRTAAGCFTREDLRLLEVFASQAAIAIENSRLFADLAASYRSLEEAQERIVRSEKLKSLGVLAGGIAHDFNNLLTSILGNADLALMYLDDTTPATPKVAEIKNAARLAGDLCSQLLAYSGKGQFVVGTLDLTDVVRGVAKMIKVSLPKKVALTFDLEQELPGIEADPTQIRQVILNLVTNAAEACEDGEGVVSVSTGTRFCTRDHLEDPHSLERLEEGRYVFLEVTDTGCGMDEEARSRLFEPFYTTKFTGRGLGLSAVLGIVRGHRGTIRVDSEPGEGTTVTVLFPTTTRVAVIPTGDTGSDEDWTRHGTVLLVDDEDMVLNVAREMLAELGLDVLTARDGREAVEVFRRRSDDIDLVILDMNMPRMGGDEAFREIRRLKRDARVVISSGYSESDTARAFEGQDLAGFMEKPYELADLRSKLKSILGNGQR